MLRSSSLMRRGSAGLTAIACLVAQLALPPRGEAAPGSSTASAGSALPPQMAAIQSFQPDLFTGRATTAIPLVVPPGRRGLQPSLALSYSSTGPDNWVGVGWALDIGAIERSTKNGVPTYLDTADTFTVSLGGVASDLVKIPDGTYRVKDESRFMRLQYLGVSGWEARDKTGTRYVFGQDAASQCLNPNGGAFRWALSKIIDPHGNTMTVSYTKDQGQLYPTQVQYTGNDTTGTAPTNRMDFLLDPATRPDVLSSYRGGFGITTAKRLSAIEVKTLIGGVWSLVRRYELSYAASRRTGRSLLVSVTTVGSDGASRLPATTFTYQDSPAPSYSVTSSPATPTGIAAWNVQSGYRSSSGDIGALMPYDSRVGWDAPSVVNTSDGWVGLGQMFSRVNVVVNADGSLTSNGQPNACLHAWTWVYVPSATNLTLAVTVGGSGFQDKASLFVEDSRGVTTIGTDTRGVAGQDTNGSMTVSLQAGWSKLHFTAYETFASFVSDNWSAAMTSPLKTLVPVMAPTPPERPQLAGDVDGNGMADVLTFDQFAGTWTVALSKGSDLAPTTTWLTNFTNPAAIPVLGDWNGDGKTDIAVVMTNNGNWRIGTSTGTSFQADTIAPFSFGVGTPFTGDFNGDGRTDIGTVYVPTGSWRFAFGSGTTFDPAGALNLTLGSSSATPLIGDFNGDGLTDVGVLDGDSVVVALSTGAGWLPVTTWRTGLPTGDYSTADVNGDGVTDLVVYDKTTGQVRYAPALSGQFGALTSLPVTLSASGAVQVADLNGDGLADVTVLSSVTNAADFARSAGTVADALAMIANGVGATTTISYQPSTQSSLSPGPGGATLPFVVPVVSQVSVQDGRGNTYTTSYTYQSGMYDAVSREFRGFGQVTVTDPIGTVTTTLFNQDTATKGHPSQVTVTDAQGNVWTKTLNTWTSATPFPGVTFAMLTQTDRQECNGDATCKTTRTRMAYDTTTGEVTTVYQDGDPGITSDDRRVETQYTTNTTAWIVKPKLIQTYNAASAGAVVAQRRFTYDNATNTDAVPTVGDLTKHEEWLDTRNVWLPTTLTYDTYGNVTSVTDPLNHTTTNTYDAAGLYLVSAKPPVVNGVTLTRSFTYDPKFGQVTSTTDANNLVTSTTYDIFGRASGVYGPNDAVNPNVTYAYALSSPISKTTVCQRITTGQSAMRCTATFTDGWGRMLQVRSPAEDPMKDVVTGSVAFDVRGLVAKQWVPYVDATSPNYVDPTSISGLSMVTYAYDALRRPTAITDATGTTTSAYDDWQVTITDANGHSTRRSVDAFGRLSKVEEMTGASTLTTVYAYDALDRLIQVTDATGSNRSTLTYDSLSRKTQQVDPDLGTWTYGYDDVNNLTQQTDARGISTTFTYDLLNRLTGKSYTRPTGSTVPLPAAVTYVYDEPNASAPYTLGKLTRVTYGTDQTSFAYDLFGQVTKETKRISGVDYAVSRSYDLLGRVTSLTYPDGEIASYTYNAQGGIETLAVGSQTLISDLDYNAAGQVTRQVNGNGVTTDYSYNPQTLRLTSLVSTSPSATIIQNLAYTYDTVGNVLTITDALRTNGQTFSYDALNRLATASGSYGAANYQVDAVGNLTQKESLTLTYPAPGAARPHAVTSATGPGANISLTYDANGNVATRADGGITRTFTFDAENRLSQVTENNTVTMTLNFKPGWNFFSLPVIPSTLDIVTLFPSFSTNYEQLAKYDPTTQKFTQYVGNSAFDDFSSLEYGTGYQLYCKNSSGCSVTLTGTRPSATSKAVAAGWNLLPAVSLTASSTAEVYRDLAVTDVQRYDATSLTTGSLSSTSTTLPAEAYWVKVTTATTWSLPVPSALNVSFGYDGDGGRVTKTTPSGTTVYVGDLYEKVPTGLITKYLFAGSQRVAAKSSDGKLYYYQPDHLGSSNVITDATGQVVEATEHLPFGGISKQGGSAKLSHQFTGQRQDDVPGLIVFPGRVYDAQLGRFLQPDPFVQAPDDPQNFNRYTYCRNNPLNLVDPSGYGWFRKLLSAIVAIVVAVVVMVVVTVATENPVLGAAAGIAAGAGTYAALTASGGSSASATPQSPAPSSAPPTALALPASPVGPTAASASPASQSPGHFYSEADILRNDTIEEYSFFDNPITQIVFGLSGPAVRALSAAEQIGGRLVLGAGEAALAEATQVAESGGRIAANRMAGKAAEAVLEETYGGAQQVYKRTSLGARYVDNLADGIAREAKVGRTALTKALRIQVAKDAELLKNAASGIDSVVYHFFPSQTGVGPTQPLRKLLEEAGIKIVEHLQ